MSMFVLSSGTSHSVYVAMLTESKELRSMDSYIKILCKIPKIFLWGVKGDFSLLRSDGGGSFCLHFWNLHKIGMKESIDLNSEPPERI